MIDAKRETIMRLKGQVCQVCGKLTKHTVTLLHNDTYEPCCESCEKKADDYLDRMFEGAKSWDEGMKAQDGS